MIVKEKTYKEKRIDVVLTYIEDGIKIKSIKDKKSEVGIDVDLLEVEIGIKDIKTK